MSSSVVELPVAGAIEEALPLVPVEHEHPLIGIARHSHQYPLRAARRASIRRAARRASICRTARRASIRRAARRAGSRGGVAGAREGDLDGAVAAAGAMPDLRDEVDA